MPQAQRPTSSASTTSASTLRAVGPTHSRNVSSSSSSAAFVEASRRQQLQHHNHIQPQTQPHPLQGQVSHPRIQSQRQAQQPQPPDKPANRRTNLLAHPPSRARIPNSTTSRPETAGKPVSSASLRAAQLDHDPMSHASLLGRGARINHASARTLDGYMDEEDYAQVIEEEDENDVEGYAEVENNCTDAEHNNMEIDSIGDINGHERDEEDIYTRRLHNAQTFDGQNMTGGILSDSTSVSDNEAQDHNHGILSYDHEQEYDLHSSDENSENDDGEILISTTSSFRQPHPHPHQQRQANLRPNGNTSFQYYAERERERETYSRTRLHPHPSLAGSMTTKLSRDARRRNDAEMNQLLCAHEAELANTLNSSDESADDPYSSSSRRPNSTDAGIGTGGFSMGAAEPLNSASAAIGIDMDVSSDALDLVGGAHELPDPDTEDPDSTRNPNDMNANVDQTDRNASRDRSRNRSRNTAIQAIASHPSAASRLIAIYRRRQHESESIGLESGMLMRTQINGRMNSRPDDSTFARGALANGHASQAVGTNMGVGPYDSSPLNQRSAPFSSNSNHHPVPPLPAHLQTIDHPVAEEGEGEGEIAGLPLDDVKKAIVESLQRKVASLERDAWIYERSGDVEVEG